MDKQRSFEQVCQILEKYEHKATNLIAILQAVQDEYRYLPEEVMTFVASSLGISPAQVFGVASFYSHFTLTPKGKYVVKICDGTACHVKKSTDILDSLKKHLNLDKKETTTKDMMFTIETVSCLGTCGLAPAVVINEEVHGLLTPDKAVQLLVDIQEREAADNE